MRLRWLGPTARVGGLGLIGTNQCFDIDAVQGQQLLDSGRAALPDTDALAPEAPEAVPGPAAVIPDDDDDDDVMED